MSERARIDVSGLPSTRFGVHALTWWGTLGFMAIEGSSLLLCLASYLYLRKNFVAYPPMDTPAPSLLIPTIGVAVYVFSLWLAWRVDRSAKAQDPNAVRRTLIPWIGIELVLCAFRVGDFLSLHTRWDSNAYGSLLWFTLGLHALLLLADVGETTFMAYIFYCRPVEKKHFVDVTDTTFYWAFLSVAWIVCYVVLFLGPHVL